MNPTPAVVDLVVHRDEKRCAWCGDAVWGERGTDWSLHHRRARGMGGDRRPDSNSPSNLVLVHGSGTTGCHGVIESRRAEALERGFLISKLSTEPASSHAVEHAAHGWTYLLSDGSTSTDPEASCASS